MWWFVLGANLGSPQKSHTPLRHAAHNWKPADAGALGCPPAKCPCEQSNNLCLTLAKTAGISGGHDTVDLHLEAAGFAEHTF